MRAFIGDATLTLSAAHSARTLFRKCAERIRSTDRIRKRIDSDAVLDRAECGVTARAHACYGRFLSAEWASLVFLNVEYPELHVKRVVEQQTTRQRVSYAEYEFEDLGGLDQANLPGHDAQDAHFASGRDQPIAWRGGPDTAQTRPAARRVKYTRLALESRCSSEDVGFPGEEARIVQQVFCGEII